MVDYATGVAVNPAFIKAYQDLKDAKSYLDYTKRQALQNKGNNFYEAEFRKAEAKFHKLDKVFCNQSGIVEGGNLTEEQAMGQVNGIMNSLNFYA